MDELVQTAWLRYCVLGQNIGRVEKCGMGDQGDQEAEGENKGKDSTCKA